MSFYLAHGNTPAILLVSKSLTLKCIRIMNQSMGEHSSFGELAKSSRLRKDFSIELRWGSSGFAVMAPHGGGIEPGTDVIADAVAGGDHAYYAFKGMRPSQNLQLHLSSIYFDEPQAMSLIQGCHTVVTVHGCRSTGVKVCLGGLDALLKKRVTAKLIKSGFKAEITAKRALRGEHRNNLCNRGTRGKGLQLEISAPLRRILTKRVNRHHTQPNAQLQMFAHCVRQGLIEAHRKI